MLAALRHRIAWLLFAGLLLGAAGRGEAETRGSGPAAGAPDSAAAPHWAFRPLVRPEVPPLERSADVTRNPIDAFVQAELARRRLALSAEADRRTLIRRASFDLLGLPPSPEEIDRFLGDDAPDAWERLVDRLLDSPHYGEKWGRMWLDLVRYADTAGYKSDEDRPLAYHYRDYVIRAFNEDQPFDRFVQEQLAGDELFPESRDAWIATGYERLWPDESNSSDVEQARQDMLNDLTGNFGAVLLGLSLGCAQCHDHKFDPLTQEDFYRVQAFFAGVVPRDRAHPAPNAALAEYRRRLDEWEAKTGDAHRELHAIEQSARSRAGAERRLKFSETVLSAMDAMPLDRSVVQHQLAFFSDRQVEAIEEAKLDSLLDDGQRARRAELRALIEKWRPDEPQPPAAADAMAATEVATSAPPTFLLAGGDYTIPLDEVAPGFPAALVGKDAAAVRIESPRPGTSGRRSALARWVTDPANPLPARVLANRLWQGHFGQGFVENANDFGTQSPPPTHPELLDWLATELVARGWKLKAMHRLIMTSAVYRQAGRGPARDAAGEVAADPKNVLYWRFPHRRLQAEELRDALLAVSGRLDPRMGGPGVRPPLPANFGGSQPWKVTPDERGHDRRSVYIHAKRNLPFPLLQAFDLPDMHESCGRRPATTIAPQALALLNDEAVLGYARSFAERVERESPSADERARIERAYVLGFGRGPEADEFGAAERFLARQRRLIESESKEGEPDAATAAFADFCHALLNANEFAYVD
ncbi:MAG: DUF1549 and DUF1553 domain-containing protein [Planctomycetales bacterium]